MAASLVYKPIKPGSDMGTKFQNIYDSMQPPTQPKYGYRPINANQPNLSQKMGNLYNAMYVPPDPVYIPGTYQPPTADNNVFYQHVAMEGQRPKERMMGGPGTLPPRERNGPSGYRRMGDGPGLSTKMDTIWDKMTTNNSPPPYRRIGNGPGLSGKMDNIWSAMANDRDNTYGPIPSNNQFGPPRGLPPEFMNTSSMPGHFHAQPHGGVSKLN